MIIKFLKCCLSDDCVQILINSICTFCFGTLTTYRIPGNTEEKYTPVGRSSPGRALPLSIRCRRLSPEKCLRSSACVGQSFSFGKACQTFLAGGAIRRVVLRGLNGVKYADIGVIGGHGARDSMDPGQRLLPARLSPGRSPPAP